MRYQESMLSPDEEIIFDVHHHPFVLWKPAVLFLGLLAAWVLALSLLSSDTAVIYAGLGILAAIIGFFLWRLLVWSHSNLVLTNHRLVYRTGVFTRQSREIPLAKVNDVSCSQMVLGRLFGSGDLVVESANDSSPFAYFNVPGPDRLKRQMLEQINAARKDSAGMDPEQVRREVALAVGMNQPTAEIVPLPPERPPLYSEIVDQIERLDAMRERGVLSDEEFQNAKEALLNRLSKERGLDS